MKTFLVIILGLIALFMGGCSLYFTLGAVAYWDGWNGYSGMILFMSLPALAAAVVLGRIALRLITPTSNGDERDD